MKKYINLISLFLVIIFLSNCDNSTESKSIHELVGVWKMTQMKSTVNNVETIISSDENTDMTMVFNEDGTFSYNIEGSTGHGTWSTNGDKLTTIEDDGTNLLDYSISGDILKISETDTEDGVTTVFEVTYQRQ